MRGPDIAEQPGRVDQATCAAAVPPAVVAPFPFIADDAELVRDLPAYSAHHVAHSVPHGDGGALSGGIELHFHSTGVTDQ